MIGIISFARKTLSKANIDLTTLLQSYKDFILENEDNICAEFMIGRDEVETQVNRLGLIQEVMTSFLSGKVNESKNKVKDIGQFNSNSLIEIPENTVLFRARDNEKGVLFNKKELFHIPFRKRYLIGNQRYSISGIPCLYLGGSAYISWEEINRPNVQTCNFSGFVNQRKIKIYDMCLPIELSSVEDIFKVGLILSCSLPANSDHLFKEQYVLPQLIFQQIIDETINGSDETICGVRYYSSRFLTNRDLFFEINENSLEDLKKMANYVFPAILSQKEDEYSKYIEDEFTYSEPLSYTSLLINNEANYLGDNEDKYKDSIFGLIEHHLCNSLGVDDGWKESVQIVCKQ